MTGESSCLSRSSIERIHGQEPCHGFETTGALSLASTRTPIHPQFSMCIVLPSHIATVCTVIALGLN